MYVQLHGALQDSVASKLQRVSSNVTFTVVADNVKFGDREHARQLGRASLGMSISGMIVTLIIVAVIVGLFFSGYAALIQASSSSSCYNGVCIV